METSAAMEAADPAGDGRLFKADFTAAGVDQLRERVREKLPEFTNYIDDSLVKDLPSRPVLGASRRLLQFAVRDAVKAIQQTSSSTEPSSKRLHSVVSTSSADNLHGRRSERSTACVTKDQKDLQTTCMIKDQKEPGKFYKYLEPL